jgi:hypothetical protein
MNMLKEKIAAYQLKEQMINRFVEVVDKNGFSTSDIVRKTDLHYQTIYNFKRVGI